MNGKINCSIYDLGKFGTSSIPMSCASIDLDGSNVEQITFDPVFDAFPMFSPDGKKLIFASNRNNGGTRDTNLFIAAGPSN